MILLKSFHNNVQKASDRIKLFLCLRSHLLIKMKLRTAEFKDLLSERIQPKTVEEENVVMKVQKREIKLYNMERILVSSFSYQTMRCVHTSIHTQYVSYIYECYKYEMNVLKTRN